MKLNWTKKDMVFAGSMGWKLRPWRYIEEDGCWTIVRSKSSSLIKSHDDAVSLVLRLGACRDFCESESQWQTCNKAAQLAMGANL